MQASITTPYVFNTFTPVCLKTFCWKCQLQLLKASCSLGNCCQPFFGTYLRAQLVSTGPPLSHGTFSRELFGWQWMGNVRKIPRKRPGWVPLCGLSPGGKLFYGYWRCLVPLKNESGQLITKLAQKLARIVKKQLKPTHFRPIPTMANGSFLEGNEGNMEETGGRTQSWENL